MADLDNQVVPTFREQWTALRANPAAALLALLLFTVPLYRTGVFEDSFNAPKLGLILLILPLMLLATLARRDPLGFCWKFALPLFAMLGLAGMHGLSWVWAGSRPLAVDGALYFAAFALLLAACYLTLRSAAEIAGCLTAGFVAAVATAVWTVFEDATGGSSGMVARLPDWRGHLAAGVGNSGHIAGIMGLFLPWGVLAFLAARRMLFWMLPVFVVMAAGFVVTWSVGSAGATLLALLVWVVAGRLLGLYRLRVGRVAALGGAAAVAAAFYLLPHPLNPHKPSLWSEAFGSARWAEGAPTRLAIWKTTGHMIAAKPVLGMGAGNFTYMFVQQQVPSVKNDPKLQPYAGAYTNDAHNEYLHLWCETGLPGLALWLAVLGSGLGLAHVAARRLDARGRLLAVVSAAGVTVFALDSLMSFPMRLPAHFAAAIFLLSIPGVLLANMHAKLPRSGLLRYVQPWLAIVVASLAGAVGGPHVRHLQAQYHLKRARALVESQPVIMGNRPVPAWHAADALYRQTLEQIVQTGETTGPVLQQSHYLSTSPVFFQAEAELRKGLGRDPFYSNASSRLGMLLIFQGQYVESISVSLDTLKTLQAFEIHERLGLAFYMVGDRARAAQHWQTAADRYPRMADLYLALVARAKEAP